MYRFKNWALRVTEPWREERAAYMLQWRIFAQANNVSSKWPPCKVTLHENEKAMVYEFPNGDPNAQPDCLVVAHLHAEAERIRMERKAMEGT